MHLVNKQDDNIQKQNELWPWPNERDSCDTNLHMWFVCTPEVLHALKLIALSWSWSSCTRTVIWSHIRSHVLEGPPHQCCELTGNMYNQQSIIILSEPQLR
jgi:hypothetical protein